MDFEVLVNIVKENIEKTNKFKVEYLTYDGSVKEKTLRFFFTETDRLCVYNKKARNYGTYFEYYEAKNIQSIKPIFKVSEITHFRNVNKKVVKYLLGSGLWKKLNITFAKLLEMSDEEILAIKDLGFHDYYERMNSIANECGGEAISIDMFLSMFNFNLKTINYTSYDKERVIGLFNQHLQEKSEYRHFWRKGYDNHISISVGKDGELYAHYSEEYLNCGNGHYYIALDAKHALYCEDD